MNPDTFLKDNRHQRNKIDMRQRGIFFMLGGLVFLLQGLSELKDNITWFLLTALVVFFIILSPQHPDEKQTSWGKRVLQLFGGSALFMIVAFVILLGLGWIWKNTGIPFPYLAAISFGSIGLVLIVLSFIQVSTKPKP